MGGGLSCCSHSAMSPVSISPVSPDSAFMTSRVLCSTQRNVPMVFHLALKGYRHLQMSAMCSLVRGGWFEVAVVGERGDRWGCGEGG